MILYILITAEQVKVEAFWALMFNAWKAADAHSPLNNSIKQQRDDSLDSEMETSEHVFT